ncbi:hypothetical protein C8Q73DRAFT_666187 [Cubamyces lactineus]|nr:hypothetical protein C8Q73DRAFT_666187 [Cubamyces lactineus]
MITDSKSPLPGDSIAANVEPEDAPPSYNAAVSVPPVLPRDRKADPSSIPNPQSSTQSPISPSCRSSAVAPSQDSTSGKPYTLTSWFNYYANARTTREVRATVAGLLQDLVKQQDAQSALGVLESCADACRAYDLSLSVLLQERTIEDHSPLYWSIVSRTPSPGASSSTYPPTRGRAEQDRDTVVMALLSHAAPLSDAAVDEVRLACLHASDHRFFQRLRRLPAFAPLSVSDEIILGGTAPVDEVEVEEVPGDEAGFVARFRIPMFQKRMRVSKEIPLEFIAKGRIWSLKFLEAARSNLPIGYRHLRTGSWVVVLSLLPHSPQTWIDSRLVIADPRTRPPPSSGPSSPFSSSVQSPAGPPTSPFKVTEDTTQQEPHDPPPKLRIEVRMKRNEQLIAPNSPRSTPHRAIAASLDEDARGPSLQLECVDFSSVL